MLAYAPVVFVGMVVSGASIPYLLFGLAVVAYSCVLPDIDMKLKNFLPIKHRGITHTVWFALFVGLVSGSLSYLFGWYATRVLPANVGQLVDPAALAVFSGFLGVYGTVSHFLGDIITPTGLKPLAPVSDKRFRFVMTVWGQTSKAANESWNRWLWRVGTAAVILGFALGSEQGRALVVNTVVELV